MALTIISQPYPVMPAYNNNYFTFSSNQVAQPNFYVQVDVTLVGESITQSYKVSNPPSNVMRFDAGVVARSSTEVSLPNPVVNVGGWQVNDYHEVTVLFTEYYSGASHATATVTYFVWPAALSVEQLKTFYSGRYVWPGTGTGNYGESQISSLVTERVYEDYSSYYHIVNQNSGNFSGLRIKVYTSAGVYVSTSDINNPYVNDGDDTHAFLSLDVGLLGLRNIAVGKVTGTYPILPTTGIDFYYEIYFTWLDGSPVAEQEALIKTMVPTCSVYPVKIVHYLNRLGAWDTCDFTKVSNKTLTVERKEAGSYYFEAAGTYNPTYALSKTKVIHSATTEELTLRTGWLTDDEVEKYKELIDSPFCYLDNGQGYTLSVAADRTELILSSGSYDVNTRYNKKRFQLTLQFKAATSDSRQTL